MITMLVVILMNRHSSNTVAVEIKFNFPSIALAYTRRIPWNFFMSPAVQLLLPTMVKETTLESGSRIIKTTKGCTA